MDVVKRKVKLFIAMSLDGYIARADGSVDWLFNDQDYGYTAFYEDIDTVLMGRHTWEQLKTFGDYPYEGKQGIVFSRALAGESDPNVEYVTDSIETWIRRAQQQHGGNFWLMGGSQLVDGCLRHDLVDEMILSVHPLLLGHGIPLFRPHVAELKLELVKSQAYSSGLVQMVYRRAK